MKKRKEQRKIIMVKRAAVIMGVVAAGFVAVIPAKALVSLVLDRMEQVPAKEREAAAAVLEGQAVGADSQSREYTQEERERMEALRLQYEQGVFPEGELLQKQSAPGKKSETPYFAQDTSTFYLPERELTDEELLQIIDFYTKRDYALMQESKKRAEAGTAVDKEDEEKLRAEGGISGEQAVSQAEQWLYTLYGASREGMEQECELYMDGNGIHDGAFYAVGFRHKDSRNYSFLLAAKDGTLLETRTVVPGGYESAGPGTEGTGAEAGQISDEALEQLYQKAKDLLTGPLGLEADYEKAAASFTKGGSYVRDTDQVSFFFLRKDGSAYEIDLDVPTKELASYAYRSDYEKYRKDQEAKEAAQEKAQQEGRSTVAPANPEGKTVYKEMKN